MSFPQQVRDDALVACARHCCLCHRFCGLKIEIHHIKPKASGGPDSFENAIPLCFDCHADMRTYDSKHPKGTKYSESELKRFRDNWYQKVENSNGVQLTASVETDKHIYNILLKTLPWDGSLSFINTNNFAGFSFQVNYLDQLTAFQYLCDNPTFEFIDSDLESTRVELLKNINIFQRLIGQYTFPTGNGNRNHVPPEWETKNPKHFDEVVNSIHDAAKLTCSSYQQLTRMATRKLGILPDFI